jgi:hypothetical protein
MTVCRLLDGFLETVPKEPRKPLVEILEHFFYVACVWAFGGALIVEVSEDGSQRGNHRMNFDNLMGAIASNIKLPKEPENATCYDFFFSPETEELEYWGSKVNKYNPVPIGSGPGEAQFSQLVVPTVDTARLTSLMNQLVYKGHPVM